MSKIDIFFLDRFNSLEEEITINKPETYQDLLNQIKNKIEKIPYEIFILDNNYKEIIIENNDDYKLIEEILLIREKDNKNLNKSMFELNYDNLSESKKEPLEQKYSCICCYEIIKKEKPYFCYKCQKISHEKCLKEWDNKCKQQNKNLNCPHCKYELPIEKWCKKLDYEDNRKDNADFLNQINENKNIVI